MFKFTVVLTTYSNDHQHTLITSHTSIADVEIPVDWVDVTEDELNQIRTNFHEYVNQVFPNTLTRHFRPTLLIAPTACTRPHITETPAAAVLTLARQAAARKREVDARIAQQNAEKEARNSERIRRRKLAQLKRLQDELAATSGITCE